MRSFRPARLVVTSLGLARLWGQQPAPEPIKIGSAVLTGSVRSRLETWQWFRPNSGDPSYSFLGNHARLNLTHAGKTNDWTIALAAPILLGLPTNAIAPGAQGQLGMGAGYFAANDRARNTAMIFPKQAFIRWRGLFGKAASSLRVGRFEFQDGSEVTAKNATMGTVKRDRVHQRLIGPFVFTHVMRSFDGAHYIYNKPKINYTLIGAFPTRGVFQVDGWGWMKTAFVYASATGQVQRGKTNTGEWRLFSIYYNDWRQVLKQDNRPAVARAADREHISVGTFGGHYVQVSETKAGPIDLLVLGAGQTGKWGMLDHRAGMVDLEAGVQPKILPKVRPWIRGGYYHGSGDGNPADGKHTTFFSTAPHRAAVCALPLFRHDEQRGYLRNVDVASSSEADLEE